MWRKKKRISHSCSLYHCFFLVEFAKDAHSVLREGWYGVNYNSKISPTMRDNPSFKNEVESEIALRDFDAPVNMVENYIQRLTSYLQVEFLLSRHKSTPQSCTSEIALRVSKRLLSSSIGILNNRKPV